MAGTAKNTLVWSRREPAKPTDYQGIIKRTMRQFNLLPPPGERHNWKKEVPRWALLVGLLVASMLIGWLASQLETSKDRQLHNLEQAYLDAPNKFVARLSERVAIVEAQTTNLEKSIGTLNQRLDSQTQATTELTIQLRLLNAEMKARR